MNDEKVIVFFAFLGVIINIGFGDFEDVIGTTFLLFSLVLCWNEMNYLKTKSSKKKGV